MTLRELAEEAGVSIGTVSKAFKNAEEISEATKEKIFEIARRQGCFHKYYKEKYEKKIVAIICPELKSEHYSAQIEYIQARLARRNIDVIISTDDFSEEKQAELIGLHAAHTKVDGMIVFGLYRSIPKGIEVPVVAIGGNPDRCHTDTIRSNFPKTMAAAVAHLKQLGHREIAFIGESLTKAVQKSFEDAMQQYELPLNKVIVANERFEEAGKNGVARLQQSGNHFTAIICAYDYIAIGAIKALKKSGLKVPEDVSVIGVNNIRTAGHLESSLTTIDQAIEATCDMACDLLKKKMQNPYYCAGSAIEITGSLIIRETTGNCKNAQG